MLFEEVGDLPVNITFMMEGAEKEKILSATSTDLEKYLENTEMILPADLMV